MLIIESQKILEKMKKNYKEQRNQTLLCSDVFARVKAIVNIQVRFQLVQSQPRKNTLFELVVCVERDLVRIFQIQLVQFKLKFSGHIFQYSYQFI